MRQRPSARLLVLDAQNRILLFRFVFKEGPLAGKQFWATPGGGLDTGETFEQAAQRELFEETGIKVAAVDQHIAERQFKLTLPNGERVLAQERFFVIQTTDAKLTNQHQTNEERQFLANYKWWTIEELALTSETIFPNDLIDILMHTSPQ